MENTHTEEKHVTEEINDNEPLPIVIEKQPRKKREKQSEAQLETLRRGRERLAEKRKQQREQRAIKNDPVTQHVSALLEKCNHALQKLEEREQVQVQVQPQVQQVEEVQVQEVQKTRRFYV